MRASQGDGFGCGQCQSPFIISDNVRLSARAITAKFRRETFRSPRSIPPMYVRSSWQRCANPSCESPTRRRSSRTRSPNRARMSVSSGTSEKVRTMTPIGPRTLSTVSNGRTGRAVGSGAQDKLASTGCLRIQEYWHSQVLDATAVFDSFSVVGRGETACAGGGGSVYNSTRKHAAGRDGALF
jgi:hypothetical protein